MATKGCSYEFTDEGESVGPKMLMALRNVSVHDGVRQSKNVLAKAVGPNGSQNYGYRIVNRCIRKGLLSRPDEDHPKANPHGQGAIKLTGKGRKVIDNAD
jgi:hypothetical protein